MLEDPPVKWLARLLNVLMVAGLVIAWFLVGVLAGTKNIPLSVSGSTYCLVSFVTMLVAAHILQGVRGR